jgi:hypothetical protein
VTGDSVVTLCGMCGIMLVLLPCYYYYYYYYYYLPVCRLFIILYVKQTVFVGHTVLQLFCG